MPTLKQNKTVAYYTLGCKLNYTETSAIEKRLTEKEYVKVPFEDIADYYIINTCSVTENADKKCRSIIRQAKRTSPNSKVVVVGCYAQLKPEPISEIEGVDLVLGAKEKFNIDYHLEQLDKGDYASFIAGDIDEVNFYVGAYSQGDRTRTFLKVQDGCDYGCAFCTIPIARGKSRSATIEQVLSLANEIAATDVKEVVLTGVNIGDFGKGFTGSKKSTENFLDLIQELDNVEGIERFRISSIEPNLLSEDIIDFVASSKRFMPHFHIPLQSGSDVLLKRMRRRYLTELYTSRINYIKEKIPNCCIGVDVIVGFPGETDELFLETYNYLNNLPISYLHVFTYSERANTAALELDGIVNVGLRRERSKQLRILSDKKRLAFYQGELNSNKSVLFEQAESNGAMFGFTENYVKVEMPYNDQLVNQIIPVELNKVKSNGFVEASLLESVLFAQNNHLQKV